MPFIFKTKNKFLKFKIHFFIFETQCMFLFKKKPDSLKLEIQFSI